MKRVLLLYRNAFGGLSRPAWMLSLIMFINRSGAMVIPFLGVYLTESLGYTLKEAGIILSIYGLGAVSGSFLGGWLTDRVGHFKVQLFSLTVGGSLYFMFLFLEEFQYIAAGVFILSLVNDMLRPANSASIAHYARPENVTRAFSLNRMALNLGFSIGPAIGGLVAAISYKYLFIGDGVASMMAGLFFFIYFRKRQGHKPQKAAASAAANTEKVRSPYTDGMYLVFILLNCGFAILFFQLLSTLPLYYRQVYVLPEARIGTLLALNGFIVFLFEMILVYLLGDKIKKAWLIPAGVLVLGSSFVVLNLGHHTSLLYMAMVLLSFSEILVMPFMATISVERSNDRNRGSYLGLYTISYAAAHVVAPYLGTTIASRYSFDTLWWILSVFAIAVSIGLYFVVQHIERERLSGKAKIAASEKGVTVG
ncbi:MFS transporter [Pontibacter chinhatensis]|uniref:Predicted arabinose efflux permease, MFS family n=1 Tax=Pontibacter chinhatensis TaxID=1436961 RepID=A0A1I2YW73_9BACT|nr:MFS transporter [Pontibacter chinhatensis]SFH29710.1 Predicted arabinose efflux permease, MFS family [Pontibacter chinhatensis]